MSKKKLTRLVKLILDSKLPLVASIRWQHHIKQNPKYYRDSAKDPCVYCGRPSETKEHIKPRSAGGKNSWENSARACRRCNTRRGSMSFLVFMLTNHQQAGNRILRKG